MLIPKNTAGTPVYILFLDDTGAPVTTGTPARAYSLDNGAQSSASPGAFAHKGGGMWTYLTTAADTNGDYGAFLFTLAGALPYDVPFFTYTGFLNRVGDRVVSGVEGVVTGSPSTTVIPVGSLPASTAGFASGFLEFTTGALRGISKPISGYTVGSSSTGTVTLSEALSAAPAAGDGVRILGFHETA